MKIFEFAKLLFAKPHTPKPLTVQKKLFYNKVEITKLFVNFFVSPLKMYRILRNLKIPNEENVFYVRNQKGFNTVLFKTKFDVIIADKNGRIIDIFQECNNNYTSRFYQQGYYVFFMPVGSIDYYKIKVNNILSPGIKYLKDFNQLGKF